MTPQRINLLYLIPGFGMGGTERLVADLVTHLDPERFAVSVCVQHDGLMGHELMRRGYRIIRTPADPPGGAHSRLRKLRGLYGRVAYLRALVRRERIDVVHTHHLGPLLHASLASVGSRRWRWVHTEHIRPDVDTGYPRWLVRVGGRLFPRVDVVTGVSDAVGAYFLERNRVAPERLRVIHNGVDVERFATRGDGGETRRELGVPDDAWVIGLVGSLRAQKNHAVLLRALARLLPEVPDARLVLAGDGELRGSLERQAQQLGLRDRVHFLGPRSDVPELLSTFDVYCLPSSYEGMPLTLFEAMAAGKPVVATRVVGIREVVTDGITGLLVPPDDPDALARALLSVRRNPGLSRALADAGRHYARTHARLTGMVDQYADLYERVLGRPALHTTRSLECAG